MQVSRRIQEEDFCPKYQGLERLAPHGIGFCRGIYVLFWSYFPHLR